jgi:hypothetical protein
MSFTKPSDNILNKTANKASVIPASALPVFNPKRPSHGAQTGWEVAKEMKRSKWRKNSQ